MSASSVATRSVFQKVPWQDGSIGFLLGFAVLHPVAMVIVGIDEPSMPGDHAGMLMHLASAMGLYFGVIGLVAGTLTGSLRILLRAKNGVLAAQAKQLEDALGENQVLLRILTHDLSNSVGCSHSLLEQMLEDAPAPVELEDLRCVESSLRQGRELIEFTHKLIAIEAGKLTIRLHNQDVCKLARESLSLFERRFAEKGVKLIVEMPAHPVECLVEPVTFKNAMLNNLLSNALKFSSPAGTVAVRLQEAEDHADLSVSNLGPGIDPERIPDLLSCSAPTTTDGTLGEKGSGLGLPLAARFARLMNGALSISADRARGSNADALTTVSVRLQCPQH